MEGRSAFPVSFVNLFVPRGRFGSLQALFRVRMSTRTWRKKPREFDIDMLRCIYCGMCEEVCPEEAIYLRKEQPIFVGTSRAGMVRHKEELYALGGVMDRPIRKWHGK